MRVLCIDKDAWPAGLPVEHPECELENGKSYEVLDVFYDAGYIWYIVFPHDVAEQFGYWENCFARTSDINETFVNSVIEKCTI